MGGFTARLHQTPSSSSSVHRHSHPIKYTSLDSASFTVEISTGNYENVKSCLYFWMGHVGIWEELELTARSLKRRLPSLALRFRHDIHRSKTISNRFLPSFFSHNKWTQQRKWWCRRAVVVVEVGLLSLCPVTHSPPLQLSSNEFTKEKKWMLQMCSVVVLVKANLHALLISLSFFSVSSADNTRKWCCKVAKCRVCDDSTS